MRRSAPDRENESGSGRRQDGTQESSLSTSVSRPVASLHRSVGNQAAQRLDENGELDAELTVSQPEDDHEREAERVADTVMSMSASEPAIDSGAEDGIQHNPGGGKTAAVGGADDGPLESVTGTGDPLPAFARAFFEPRFGRDFGDVRVHTGPSADRVARSIGAEAFTHGNDVVFRSGNYDPRSREGKRLLAHELTHTVQQGAAGRTPAGQTERSQPRVTGAPESDATGDALSISTARTPDINRAVPRGGRAYAADHESAAEKSTGGDIPEIYEDGVREFAGSLSRAEKKRLLGEMTPEGGALNETAESGLTKMVLNEIRNRSYAALAEYLAGASAGTTVGFALSFLAIPGMVQQMLKGFAAAQDPMEPITGAQGKCYGTMYAIKRPEGGVPAPPSDVPAAARKAFREEVRSTKAEKLQSIRSASPREVVAFYTLYKADSSTTEDILNEMWSRFRTEVPSSTAKRAYAPDTLNWPAPESGIRDVPDLGEDRSGMYYR